jgi:hypothetical protein
MDVAEGDEIVFSKYGGTEIKLGTDDVLILRESDVLAKVVNTGGKRKTQVRRRHRLTRIFLGGNEMAHKELKFNEDAAAVNVSSLKPGSRSSGTSPST